MDIKIRCPHCETKLIVGDELVGQAVLCEDCNTQFTVEQPASATKSTSKSGEKPRVRTRERHADDEVERPRSRRSPADFDDEDDRPIRRKPKRSSSRLAPVIFGSLLVVMTLGVGVGLYFAFGFGTSTNRNAGMPNPNPVNFGGVPVAGNRFKLSDARWLGGNTFMVTIESTTGRPDATPARLVYRTPDGLSNALPFSMAFTGRQSLTVPKLGGARGPTTIWVEQSGFGAGPTLSNTLTLN